MQQETGASFLSRLISLFVSLALIAGSVIFVFMLLFGAIEWMTSGGDKAAAENARSRITKAVIGIIILFSVFAIVKVVEGLFDINILQIDITKLGIGS